jgi:outer membrane protein assembly factor BamB
VGKVVALRKADGALLWQSEAFIESYASPSAPFLWENRPHVAFFKGTGLVILRVEDGHESWRKPWRTPQFDTNTSTPLIQDGKVFISSGYDRGCALLQIGNASESAVLWQGTEARSQYNTAILSGGHLYGFFGKDLKCLEFDTGKVKWTEPMADAGCQILADGKLLILSERGELVVAEPNPQAYKEISRSQALGGRCWTLPVLSNGRIYCRNSRGDVVCLDVKE